MEDNESKIQLIDDNVSQIEQLLHRKVDIWLTHVLFSRLWWLGGALTVVPWILWLLFRKKQSTDRLLYAGFFVMVAALVLDVLGDQLGYWHYRFNVIPVLPTYAPWDISLMPVTVMFFLQIKPRANPFLKAVLFALLASYVGEPLFKWIGIYYPKSWRFIYSVPIQIVIYLIAHYISRRSKHALLT